MGGIVLLALAIFFVELLVTGAIVGWLASLIAKGYGLGLKGNILVGIIGAVVIGGLLIHFGYLGDSVLWVVLDGVIGAVILLVLVGIFKKKPAAGRP
jgi:uncharacterized membrane protein YeaQ/YmgE (transglycosylase-associated protein family)